MRGKRYAVREHVFARLAQKLGLCVQSSTYLCLDDDAPPRHERGHDRTAYQLAIWMIDTHQVRPCEQGCGYLPPRTMIDEQWWGLWLRSGVQNPWHWFDSQVLGLICAQHEPSQGLVTANHTVVQIDNEQMFGAWPFERKKWSRRAVEEVLGSVWLALPGGRARIRSLCKRLSRIDDADVDFMLTIPDGYKAKYIASEFRKWLRQVRHTAVQLHDVLGLLGPPER